MKVKTISVIFIFIVLYSRNLLAYFDGGINYTTGKDGYQSQDVYILVGYRNLWIKPEYFSWKADNTERFQKMGMRMGFEKASYTIGLNTGYTPKKSGYKDFSFGCDITFSLNPTSSSRRRLAGPNSGFVSRSGQGVTQIDVGGGLEFIKHDYDSGSDINETDFSVFAGAKVFITQISINYTAAMYDNDTDAKQKVYFTQKVYGLNSVFKPFVKSNFNFRIEIPQTPIVNPYISYNKIKTKTNDVIDAYVAGAYIDLAMLGITTQFEVYKDVNDKTQRFLSLSAGLRF